MRPVSIERIVVINDLAVPAGGASALALMSARGFAARGHAVTVISGDRGDTGELAGSGISVHPLGQERLLRRSPWRAALSGLWNPAAARLLADWIARHDTPGTVYHVHGWSQILSPAVFHALAPVRARMVISAHDFFVACPNGAFAYMKTGAPCPHVPLSARCIGADCDRDNRARKLWRVVRHAVQQTVLRPGTAPPILAIHSAMEPLLIRAGFPAAAIYCVPNPVDPWSLTRLEAETAHDVLFVGRLEATKGPDLALAAARQAGVRLQVVGSGAMEAELRARHPEACFAGRLSPTAVTRLARHARLLIMPSRHPEPYGLVAMEAALSGLPVVLSPTALLASDLVARGAGVAVDPRDTARLAQVLADLAHDDRLVRTMSEAAFGGTRDLALSPAEWLDRLLDIYAARLAAVSAGGEDGDAAGARYRGRSSGVWRERGAAAARVKSLSGTSANPGSRDIAPTSE